jgi:hypothetical protein
MIIVLEFIRSNQKQYTIPLDFNLYSDFSIEQDKKWYWGIRTSRKNWFKNSMVSEYDFLFHHLQELKAPDVK